MIKDISTFLYKNYGFLFIVILLLIINITIYRFFDKKNDILEIEIPEMSNSKSIENPEPLKKVDTIYRNVIVKGQVETVREVVEVENPINIDLMVKYQAALKENDSIKQIQLYREAITERNYREVLEDSIQKITVESLVIGTLKNQRISYKTKKKTIKVDIPSNGSLYFGLSADFPTSEIQNITGQGFSIALKAHLVNRKRILTLGFNSNEVVTIGFAIKL